MNKRNIVSISITITLFTDYTVRFRGIIRTQFTKTLLEWINEIRKVIEQNINEKYVVFLCTSNKQLKIKLLKITFIMLSKIWSI